MYITYHVLLSDVQGVRESPLFAISLLKYIEHTSMSYLVPGTQYM